MGNKPSNESASNTSSIKDSVFEPSEMQFLNLQSKVGKLPFYEKTFNYLDSAFKEIENELIAKQDTIIESTTENISRSKLFNTFIIQTIQFITYKFAFFKYIIKDESGKRKVGSIYEVLLQWLEGIVKYDKRDINQFAVDSFISILTEKKILNEENTNILKDPHNKVGKLFNNIISSYSLIKKFKKNIPSLNILMSNVITMIITSIIDVNTRKSMSDLKHNYIRAYLFLKELGSDGLRNVFFILYKFVEYKPINNIIVSFILKNVIPEYNDSYINALDNFVEKISKNQRFIRNMIQTVLIRIAGKKTRSILNEITESLLKQDTLDKNTTLMNLLNAMSVELGIESGMITNSENKNGIVSLGTFLSVLKMDKKSRLQMIEDISNIFEEEPVDKKVKNTLQKAKLIPANSIETIQTSDVNITELRETIVDDFYNMADVDNIIVWFDSIPFEPVENANKNENSVDLIRENIRDIIQIIEPSDKNDERFKMPIQNGSVEQNYTYSLKKPYNKINAYRKIFENYTILNLKITYDNNIIQIAQINFTQDRRELMKPMSFSAVPPNKAPQPGGASSYKRTTKKSKQQQKNSSTSLKKSASKKNAKKEK